MKIPLKPNVPRGFYWIMDYNKDKVDDMTLALLHLVMFDDKYGTRAWKGFDWETMNRLHQKGYIADPKGKAKSMIVTEEAVVIGEFLTYHDFGIIGGAKVLGLQIEMGSTTPGGLPFLFSNRS